MYCYASSHAIAISSTYASSNSTYTSSYITHGYTNTCSNVGPYSDLVL